MDCLKQLSCKVPTAAVGSPSSPSPPPSQHLPPGRKQLLTRRFSDPSSDNMVSCDWPQCSLLIGPDDEYCGQVSYDWCKAGHNAHL